jgi:PAS domain S-box-containing protein
MNALAQTDRLRSLYEISTLLTRYEGFGRTLPEVVAVAARALPIRTAVLLLGAHPSPQSHAWKTDDVDETHLSIALARARETYAWFTEEPALSERDSSPPSIRGLPGAPPSAPADSDRLTAVASPTSCFLLLPLLVERGRVFGVLQVEGAAPLDEADVSFVNAAANQVAVAIERQAAIDDAEARVRAQLDFTRALTQSLGEGIIATDVDGRITFLNPAAEYLLGWTESALLGTYAPHALRVQTAEGRVLGAGQCPLVRTLETFERLASDENSFIGRDGVAVPVSYTSTPMRSAGRCTGAVLVFRDVLAVKLAERTQRLLSSASAALAESLDYRTTLAALVRCAVPAFADCCFVDEVEEGVDRVDDAMAARTAKEDSGVHVRYALPPSPTRARRPATLGSDRAVLVESVSDATLADLADEEHVALLRGSGVRSLVAVPLCVRGRTFGVLTLGMAASGRQYTEADLPFAEEIGRRAAIAIDNARLHRETEVAVRDRQDILAMVSHDIRTPLNVVYMAATSLLERRRPGRDVRDLDRREIEMIERAAKRMNRMTMDLLDVSSIEAGHLAVDVRAVATCAIISDLLEATARGAASKAVRLVVGPVDPLLMVCCDHGRILQVLENIVTNAIKFTPTGGLIELTVEPRGDFVRIAVANTGLGIVPSRVPHVFERYWQAKETAATGRGLGLFIAKGIVEAHGGTIGVESEVGEGTTFFFTLRRVLAPLASVTERPASAAEDTVKAG